MAYVCTMSDNIGTNTLNRLMDKIDIKNDDECWLWKADKSHNGYGQFYLNGKTSRSHRLIYELYVGDIPDGKQICHKCDNPACCNPKHLFICTQQENIQDMRNKGRQKKTTGSGYYKVGRDALSPKQVEVLIDAFDRISDKALISLAIACGIRRNDIVQIERNNINLETGHLTFYEHKKSRIWEVYIPSQACIATLNQHINSSRKSKWLFPSPKITGKFKEAHLSDRQAYDIFNEALAKCKLEPRPFHACRATCVKQCLDAGWSWEAIGELTGDRIETLMYHYATPSKGEMAQMAKEKPII